MNFAVLSKSIQQIQEKRVLLFRSHDFVEDQQTLGDYAMGFHLDYLQYFYKFVKL